MVMYFRLRGPSCQELRQGGLDVQHPRINLEQRLWLMAPLDRRCTWFGLPGVACFLFKIGM